eukprot:1194457-Prorocentrum_minimum.AAC.2
MKQGIMDYTKISPVSQGGLMASERGEMLRGHLPRGVLAPHGSRGVTRGPLVRGPGFPVSQWVGHVLSHRGSALWRVLVRRGVLVRWW